MVVKAFLLFGLLCTVSIVSLSEKFIIIEAESQDAENKPGKLSVSNIVLVDKVYTLTKNIPILRFDKNLYFEKAYYYDILIAVVSPNTCTMGITLWDPEGDQYDLSSEQNLIQDDYRVIPFGAALNGNYSIQFEATLSENLNIHIIIERSIKCLNDQIGSSEEVIYFNISKFFTGSSVIFRTTFKTDKYYKFYFYRVSPITVNQSNQVVMDHYVLDPKLVKFTTFNDVSLGFVTYYFGAASSGLYTFNIVIYSEILCSNIAYAIVEKESITDITDPNNPDPSPDDEEITNHTQSNVKYYIPTEWTIGVMIFVGMSVGIPVVLILQRRKKNSMKL